MTYLRKQKRKKEQYNKTDKCVSIKSIYNTSQWTKLRAAHLMYHPLCEMCLEEGKTKSAEEVHHIQPISTGRDTEQMKALAYDPCNLMSLCKLHHYEIHKQLKQRKISYIL